MQVFLSMARRSGKKCMFPLVETALQLRMRRVPPPRHTTARLFTKGTIITQQQCAAVWLYMWGQDDSTTSTKILKNEGSAASTKVFTVPTKVEEPLESRLPSSSNSSKIRQVICGPTDTAFLLEDGTCWVMGENKQGQLGVGHKNPVTQLTKVELPTANTTTTTSTTNSTPKKIQQVSLGMNFSAFVDEVGDLYTTGFGGSAFSGMGWLGHGNADSVVVPKRVESLVEDGCAIASVAVSELHMTCLTTEGEVLTTGAGSYGRLGNYDTAADQLYLEPVEMLTAADHIVSIAGGKAFSLALTKDGIVYSWGRNHKGQLGTGLGLSVDIYAMQAVPEPIQSEELLNRKIVQVSAGHSHAACVSSKGEVFHWGMTQHFDPVPVTELLHTKIVHVSCGEDYTLAMDERGNLYSWGNSKSITFGGKTNGVLGQGPDISRSPIAAPVRFSEDATTNKQQQQQQQRVIQISAGWKHAACLAVPPPPQQQQQQEHQHQQ